MKPKLIVINGKTYNSVDAMPEDVRKQYEEAMGTLKEDNKDHLPDAFENMNILADQDKDGMPDVFENISSNVIVAGGTKIIVDGKEFNNPADLRPDIRIRYEQAMGKLDTDHKCRDKFWSRSRASVRALACQPYDNTRYNKQMAGGRLSLD